MIASPELTNQQLGAWANFFMIVGSAGGALIGIQFVVVALVADIRIQHPTFDSINAFGTPNVVHFSSTLLVSAIMSVPWTSVFSLSVALAVCGFGGLGYGLIVIRRARRQTVYKPVWDDWLWYMFLPCSAYLTLAITALSLRPTTQLPLFVIGAATLGLLLIGIHNAWDSMIHLVITGFHADPKKKE
jgi:hypothetical protein